MHKSAKAASTELDAAFAAAGQMMKIDRIGVHNYSRFDDMVFWRENGCEREPTHTPVSEQMKKQLANPNLQVYAEEASVDCIVFNLGYLPGGDHSIATHAESTIQALEQSLRLLKPLGMIAMAIYHGGDTGFAERDAVLDWLKGVDHKQYTVMVTDFYNRPNHPPLAVCIIREQ
jgi:hypothetical protein